MRRRAFLQQAGLALTALGMGEAGFDLLAVRYQQALAQPTRRKLALLVGINQYPEQVSDRPSIRGNTLNGCLTDVELQQELLIHRFGFQPSDILTLTNQQATRQAIETAFLSHLVDQAASGDVVVFHFSGLGSRVRLGDAAEDFQNSLVPVDGVLPTEENPGMNDLLEETLGLLLRSLQTDQVTTVLDMSYVDASGVVQGNLRTRSRPSTPSSQMIESERLLQEQLLSQIKSSREQLRSQVRSGRLPGVLLTAAEDDQVALEGQWNGFSAGLFTYALTQQLWGSTPATVLRTSLSRAIATMNQWVGEKQQPRQSGQNQDSSLHAYCLKPDTTAADGVVTAIEEDGKTIQVWLGGLPASVLEYGTNSLLSLCSAPLAEVAPGSNSNPDAVPSLPAKKQLFQIHSREGLTLEARFCGSDLPISPIQTGQRVQEVVRVLPRNIGLTVALDSSLKRIERVDATSAFAGISKVSSGVAGEQSADYLFGKVQPPASALTASLPSESPSEAEPPQLPQGLPAVEASYGLFNLGRSAIPNTLVKGDEAVKTAVNRMTPQLRTLLAIKLLRLTENQGSSCLGVQATLEMVLPQERIVIQQETSRAPGTLSEHKLAQLFDQGLPTLPVNSRIRYRLHNYSDRPVYFILLGLDSGGNAIALSPPALINAAANSAETPSNFNSSMISPGQTLVIPQTSPSIEGLSPGSTGLTETHLIFCDTPFIRALAALASSLHPEGDTYRVGRLSNLLEVVQAVLQDLHQDNSVSLANIPVDTYALDVNTWTTFSFVYRVNKA